MEQKKEEVVVEESGRWKEGYGKKKQGWRRRRYQRQREGTINTIC